MSRPIVDSIQAAKLHVMCAESWWESQRPIECEREMRAAMEELRDAIAAILEYTDPDHHGRGGKLRRRKS